MLMIIATFASPGFERAISRTVEPRLIEQRGRDVKVIDWLVVLQFELGLLKEPSK